ncbi:MAG TPA: hypothetical protein DD640_02220 [Clostridiales bacterium]|nr:hypothetical protein [Clostridiales bacterium]
MMTPLERFVRTMDYSNPDRVPNYEVGVWAQTIQRWEREGLEPTELNWDFMTGEARFDMDPRQFIPVNYRMLPAFEPVLLERTEHYEIIRNEWGMTVKELIDGSYMGARASMGQYLKFPVENAQDFQEIKKRFIASTPARYPAMWQQMLVPEWKARTVPLMLGNPTGMLGFYWRMREWMGTENLSIAFFEQPELIDDMCSFIADFTIEVSRPILKEITPDFIWISEDMAMKGAPLLGPETYRRFIYPHMKRLVEFMRGQGIRYVAVDSDGDPEQLMPLLMDAGVDTIWPLERAAGVDPWKWRQKFGKSLRLWGGVDKRVLARDKAAIDSHLAELQPLLADGGFIPSVDHLVPPDVSLENYLYYMERKQQMLRRYGG